MRKDMGVPASPSGSSASHEAAKAFSPEASIPNAGEPAYELPPEGADIDWREECRTLVTVWGKGHCTCYGKIVPGAYDAWERAWLLLNRDERGTISLGRPSRAFRAEETSEDLMIALASADYSALPEIERDSDTRPQDGDAQQGSTRE